MYDEDTILMLRMADGDDTSFEKFYNKYILVVINYMSRNNCPRTLLEDLAHEVFLRILENKEKFRCDSKFITYLFGYAKNVLLEEKLTTCRVALVDGEELSNLASKELPPDVKVQCEDTIEHVKGLLIQLPTQQQLAFKSTCIDELPVSEAAKLIGCSEESIYNNVHRARKRLRRLLK